MAKESQKGTIFKDKTFKKTFLEEPSKILLIAREPYPLEETHYIILTKVRSSLSFWAHGILIIAGGLFLSVASKFIDSLISKQVTDIKNWELIALGLVLLIGLFLKGLSICRPDEKKKLLKKIGEHFKIAKKIKGVFINNEKR